MSARKYTILIIPEGSHRVRRFSIRRRTLATLLGLGMGVSLALFLASSFIFTTFFRTNMDRDELHRLQTQNRIQKKEFLRLAANLEDLRQEMVVLSQNDAKVRVLAKLTGPSSEALNGVGGPPEAEVGNEITDLQKRIDEVRQAIDLRRESQEEIQGYLNDQRSLLAAKPKGWPVRGWVTSNFGVRDSPFSGLKKMHEGLDIAARTGTPIYASADGIVSQAETAAGYGKLIVIDHGYGYKTYYGHNSKLFVKVGQRVRRGEKIAAVGNTGSSTGSHLHYEVRLSGIPLNPRKFL